MRGQPASGLLDHFLKDIRCLLPDLFFLLVVLFVAQGDFLFLLCAQSFAVEALVHGSAVAHPNSGRIAFQAVSKLYHIAHKATSTTGIHNRAGGRRGRYRLGRQILGGEKRFSFGFPACSATCSRGFVASGSLSTCVLVKSCARSSLTFFGYTLCRSSKVVSFLPCRLRCMVSKNPKRK